MDPAPQETRNAACARALANALVAGLPTGSLRHVVISPGSRSTPLVLALADDPRFCLQAILDERAAAFVALGLSQASGRAAIVVTTSGSAAAHALPAAMEAHHAGVPLIILTADRPAELQGRGAPQTTPQTELYAQHARSTVTLEAPLAGQKADMPAANHEVASWRAAGIAAIGSAEGSWPGPVHINARFRSPLGSVAAPREPEQRDETSERAPPVDLSIAPDCLAHLARAERGLIVCGPQAPACRQAPGYGQELWALAQHLGWPVLAEVPANLGAPPEGSDEALCLPPAALLLTAPNSATLPTPDVIVTLGLAASGQALQSWLANVRPAARIVVNPDGLVVDPDGRASHLVAASPSRWLRAARSRLAGSVRPSQLAFNAAWRRAALDAQSAWQAWQAGTPPLFEGTAIAAFLRGAPEATTLVIGNSLAVRDLDAFASDVVRARRLPLFVAARRGVSGIEGALSHLLGVALHEPRGSVVGIFGDLTFLHDLQSLRLLAAADRAVRILLLDNGGGEIFAGLPIASHEQAFERLFRTPQHWQPQRTIEALGGTYRSAATVAEVEELASRRPAESAAGVEVLAVHLAPLTGRAIRQSVSQSRRAQYSRSHLR